MKIFAMSDIHGCLAEFEEALSLIDLSGDNILILLGDYIHGPDSYGVLDRIMALQGKYGSEKVIALMGNHEEMVLDGMWPINGDENDDGKDDKYISWIADLPLYYATDKQIFCHAGIDEEAEDLWEVGTDDYTFTQKYPAQTGYFYMDIIAGHVGTAAVSGDPRFHDIYFDGESHYYIDGSVLGGGKIPVLMLDTDSNKYYSVTENGSWLVLPYDEIDL